MTLSKYNKHTISRRSFLQRGSLVLPLWFLPQSLPSLLLKEQYVHRTAFGMGTTVSIQAFHHDRALLLHAISAAFDELHRLDALFSNFQEESDISRINRNAGNALVQVNPLTLEIMNTAIKFSKITGGGFDCTVEPLMQLWGFRSTTAEIMPTDSEIDKALVGVGYNNIIVDNKASTIGLKHSHASIDLGGIAVGFTVDRMASILRREGITSALINHSGDLYALDAPPDSPGWKIGIPSPFNKNEIVEESFLIHRAVSTSGSYEKYVTIGDRHYGHIMSLESGKPADKLRSVSVFSGTSLDSDVISTAIFSGISSQGLTGEFLQDTTVIMIDHEGNIIKKT